MGCHVFLATLVVLQGHKVYCLVLKGREAGLTHSYSVDTSHLEGTRAIIKKNKRECTYIISYCARDNCILFWKGYVTYHTCSYKRQTKENALI